MLFLSEDIGRHNAVDKVIGRGLLTNVSFGTAQLLTTGRISSDIVMKTARAGIPVVISLSIATSLAVDLALRAGILLIGRGAKPEPIVYR
jgi:FdhD protein